MWNEAENKLREVLKELNVDYFEAIGEAAFYGPKLDVEVKPAVGPEVTLSTCQLDFLLPRRFNLSFINRDGEKETPVVLHRAIFGTFDRFTAFLLEETKGILPFWLAPLEVNIIPVSVLHHLDYCNQIRDLLRTNHIRCEVDTRSEKLGYKMRESQMKKVPHTIVIGDNEVNNKSVNYRLYSSNETNEMPLDDYLDFVLKLIKERK